jgi:signal recognition particle subunit SRP54
MFAALQEKLESAFQRIKGRTTISQKDIEETLKEVRMALLGADVHFAVTKGLCERIAQKALGEQVMKSLNPSQQIIKIVFEELTETMGPGSAQLAFTAEPPFIIMLVGLQGAGKTTTAAKLALLLRREFKKRTLLVPADIYRPAAIKQLQTLGNQLQIPVFPSTVEMNPVDIARQGVEEARRSGVDAVIIDTAGRLQIDNRLMDEVRGMREAIHPHEILLVADSMTGQTAVDIAKGFHDALSITGLVLTKLDGDTRGGAALSMRAVTGQPIKFVGVSEKPEGLELFHPDRMASRILGMGDVLTLIEKAQREMSIEDTEKLHKKFKRDEFTLDDFLTQMRTIRRMGSITSLTSMIPGMGKMLEGVDPELPEREMKRVEAIILSMTPQERRNTAILDGSRRRRIARGSGTSVEAVNQLVKQFTEMKKMMQQLTKGGLGGLAKMLGGKLPGGMPGIGGLGGFGGAGGRGGRGR